MAGLLEALKKSSKGQLQYDRHWIEKPKLDVPKCMSISVCIDNKSPIVLNRLLVLGERNSAADIASITNLDRSTYNNIQAISQGHRKACKGSSHAEARMQKIRDKALDNFNLSSLRLDSETLVDSDQMLKSTLKVKQMQMDKAAGRISTINPRSLLSMINQKLSADTCNQPRKREENVVVPASASTSSILNSTMKFEHGNKHKKNKLEDQIENYFVNSENYRLRELTNRIQARLKQVKGTLDEIAQDHEESEKLIRQKYLLINLQKSKQYREEFNQTVEQVLSRPNQYIDDDAGAKMRKAELAEQRKQNEIWARQIRTRSEKIRPMQDEVIHYCQSKKVDLKLIRPFNQLVNILQSNEMILTRESLSEADVKESDSILSEAQKTLAQCMHLVDKIATENAEAEKDNKAEPGEILNKQSDDTASKDKAKEQAAYDGVGNASVEQRSEKSGDKLCTDESVGSFWLKQDFRTFYELQIFKLEMDERLLKLQSDPRLKKQTTEIKLFIQTNVNGLSCQSIEHMRDKIRKLVSLFQGKSVDFKEQKLNVLFHPDAAEFAMYTTVRSFLTVGIKQVIKSVKTLYTFAAVQAAIWSKIPQFGKILLTELQHDCPYIVPYYPTRVDGDKKVSYLIACGYKTINNNTELESEFKFLDRMTAYVQMYGAIIQTNLAQHPHGMQLGWKWLACVLNLEPRHNITPTILNAFLSATNYRMYHVYRKQYYKLIKYLANDYLPKIRELYNEIEPRQSVQALGTLIEIILNELNRGQPPQMPTGYIDFNVVGNF